MTTVPWGEAGIPTHSDSRSPDSPAVGSQSQVSLPAVGPAASGAASTEQQDVDPASIRSAASKATAASGEENQHEDEAGAGHSQEPKKATAQLARPAPDARQTSLSLQNLVWAGPVQDLRKTRSLRISHTDSLVKEETPQRVGIPNRERDLDPSTPSAEAQFPQNVPAVGITDADSQLDTIEAVEKSEGPEAVNPDTEALPSAESQAVTEGDLIDCSSASTVALGRRRLDSSLYIACEENAYMRSMTSLLGAGEGSISCLADILVWSEATMSLATGLLASGHISVTYLLHSPGPSLRLVSSILGNARLAFSSGLVLRSVNRMLERMEQRTVDGICSAICYMTSQLTHSGLNAY
ncbi:PREDICTED: uncharacterized protein C2orf57 homolog [Myotis davidii]|uniref:Testis-expressed protein 44 n=1 Tax=Myotis davidii TaxID=225400 RepID=L5M1S1_MYODS|nr:PREDICTED: uncharacterized protein C2orf57 homolog [Myotis davidii]ELK32594.1 hypothetical protein MDA_GLEAN10026062 [Myotis davidii]